MEARTGAMSRRAFTATLSAAGLTAFVPIGSAAASTTSESAAGPWARRARASYEALQKNLYLPDSGLYQENYPTRAGENPYSYVWPLREAAAATQDMNQLAPVGKRYDDDVRSRFNGLERYFDDPRGAYDSYPPEPLGTRGDPFYDDNGVIGLEYMRRYRLVGDQRALRRAARAFRFVTQAWDEESTGKCAGGMHWVDAAWNPYQGATNVTSIAAELAAHLYEETGNRDYLRWAERCYNWVHGCLRSGTGLYANGIRLDKTVEDTLWTYNSGFMIGAATLLHRSTHQRSWLRRAEQDTIGALDYWTYGDRLYSQPVVFNAIFFANLLLFCSERPQRTREVLRVFHRYAERLWDENRDEDTGLFRFQASGGGAPDPDQRPQALHQSGATQIFALLPWRRSDYPDAT